MAVVVVWRVGVRVVAVRVVAVVAVPPPVIFDAGFDVGDGHGRGPIQNGTEHHDAAVHHHVVEDNQ